VSFRQVFGSVFPLETVIAAVVFGLVAIAMIAAFAVSRHKRRRGEAPSRREHLVKVEAVFGVALAGMAAFLAFTSFNANAQEFPSKAVTPAVTVKVTAFQWCWRFGYAGSPVTVTGACVNGKYPVLEIPAGVPVKFDVESDDVIHAFWVPYLDTKVDAFPGHVTTFTTTVANPGEWIGRCDQFCGLYHSEMDFYLKAVPLAQFKSWLQGQTAAQAGVAS
jgi:cytochrome c oxidase subunit II